MEPHNHLLAVFPKESLARIEKFAQTVDLSDGQLLQSPGQEIRDVYFPLTCLISVT
jgi:hypothetical protein